MHVGPPKSTFLYALEIHLGLLAHSPNGDEGSLKNFLVRTLKIWLKIIFSSCVPIFGVSRSNLTKHFHATCCEAGVMGYGVQVFEGPPQQNLGGQKAQNSTRFLTTFDFDREYLQN